MPLVAFRYRVVVGLIIAAFVVALGGCSDEQLGILAPDAMSESLIDHCPEKIEEETGEAARECNHRTADYQRVKDQVDLYVNFENPECRDAWERAKELMDRGNVHGYTHTYPGWWEGRQSPDDSIWLENTLWDVRGYRETFYQTLMHESGHSIYGEDHAGNWDEILDSCMEA